MSNVDWLNACYTRSYVSQHYEDWDRRIFCDYSIDDLIKVLDETNPEFLLITARTHNGKWFCDVGQGETHKGLKDVDQLKAITDHFHKKGKRVVAYVSAVYDQELYERHVDWKQVTAEGQPVAGGDDKSWGKIVCLNSPYREYLTQMTTALVETHAIDGVFFDMTFFDKEDCYCGYCQKKWAAKYNAPLPKKDWNSPAYRNFVKFRIDSNYTFVKDICDAVKRANPKASTAIQYRLLYDTITMTGQSLKVGTVSDYLYFDPYIEDGFLKASVCTRLISQISRHMPEISLVTRPGKHTDNPNMKPLEHMRMDAFTAIANGGAVQLFDVMMPNGKLQDVMWKRIGKVFREVEQREPWLGGTPLRSVALFYSEKSRLWHGQGDPRERYDNNFFGWAKALLEEHIPFMPIHALTADSLKDYQVLVLPNAACLSKAEIEVIREFVRGGGGLVSTKMTSLYDENGAALDNYGLADVLGVDHYGDTSAYTRVYSKFDTASPIAARIPEDGLMSSWGAMQTVTLKPGASAAATIVYPLTEATGKRFINIMVNPPAVETDLPACIENTYGKGKSVYFPGSFDSAYVKLNLPEMKWLLADAVRYVSQAPLRLELKAPSCVELSAYERQDGEELVVHLVNYQPEIGRTIAYGYGNFETRHVIQETLPVFDLQLAVSTERKIAAIHLQPGGAEVPFEVEDGVARLTIPKLENHSMVVIAYGA